MAAGRQRDSGGHGSLAMAAWRRRSDDGSLAAAAAVARRRRQYGGGSAAAVAAGSDRDSRGSTEASYFSITSHTKNETPKFHVTCSFYSRESKSLLPPPPSQWQCTLPRVYLVERGDEIEGGKKPFMRAVEKGFQGELTGS